jgi:hypothetical protein
MPWVEFEATISVVERTKTFHALDCGNTVTGSCRTKSHVEFRHSDLMTPVAFGNSTKLWKFLLFSVHNCLISCSILRVIFSSTPHSQISQCFPLGWETRFHTLAEKKKKKCKDIAHIFQSARPGRKGACRYFTESTTYPVLFREVISINYWTVVRNVIAALLKIAILWFGAPAEGSYFWS